MDLARDELQAAREELDPRTITCTACGQSNEGRFFDLLGELPFIVIVDMSRSLRVSPSQMALLAAAILCPGCRGMILEEDWRGN